MKFKLRWLLVGFVLAVCSYVAIILVSDEPSHIRFETRAPVDISSVRGVEELVAFMESANRYAGFSSVSALSIDDNVVLKTVHGIKTPGDEEITFDTQFGAGSIAKQFTAAAVLRTLDRKGIPASAKICTVLPETCDGPLGKASLQQLLDHQSGLLQQSVICLSGSDL